MSKIFFTSDLHFSHKNIANLCPQFRRFASIEEMDEHLVAMWNRTVSPKMKCTTWATSASPTTSNTSPNCSPASTAATT